MATSRAHPDVSPLTSPEIRVSQPIYFGSSPRGSPPRGSPPRGSPPRGSPYQAPYGLQMQTRPERRSKFEEGRMDPGLGIQMENMQSPVSPDHVYKLQKPGLYSPLSPSATEPRYFKTPETATSFGSSLSRSRTDPITERLIAHRSTQAARWEIHWRTPLLMVVTFAIGICLAIGQHLLYSSLHHRAQDDEGKKVRMVLYGRALAYFSKVAFCGCCILVFRQRIWTTFRNRQLTVWSIDQLFLATEDPSLFANWEPIIKAPLVTGIALIIWLIPLATIIFSPGALSFGWYLEVSSSNISVPTLNFTAESYKDWRTPVKLPDGSSKKSIMFYNTTDKTATEPGWFDYYDKQSTDVNRVALMIAYSLQDQPLNRQDARLKSCGGNYNCTYTTEFVGPGYKCEMLAKGAGDDAKLSEIGAPFNTSVLVPQGKHVYIANVSIGDYNRPQADNLDVGGVPKGTIPDNLGIFTTEPVLWLGYSINSTEKLPSDSPYAKNWTARYDPYIFRCIHYETKYTVKWNYTEPFFSTNFKQEFIAPIIDTNYSRKSDGTLDIDSGPGPTSNFISPRTNVPLYKKTAAYHAIGQMFRQFLKGEIELEPEFPGPTYARVETDMSQTRLVSNTTNSPEVNFPDQIQEFYANMVLSLFSAPQLLVMTEEHVVVNRTRYQSTFIYNPEKLWGCYAPVIGFTLMILVVGAWTIWRDGTTFSVGFSRIMVTTRNTTLDEISRGACLGNDPFPMELMHTQLQFGVLNESYELEYMGIDGLQGVGHCAFGVPSEVSPIHKGVPYAGLKKRPHPRLVTATSIKEKVD